MRSLITNAIAYNLEPANFVNNFVFCGICEVIQQFSRLHRAQKSDSLDMSRRSFYEYRPTGCLSENELRPPGYLFVALRSLEESPVMLQPEIKTIAKMTSLHRISC